MDKKKIKSSPEFTKALNILLRPNEEKKDNELYKKLVIHELKTWPDIFFDMLAEEKNFDFRINDRKFKVGDLVKFLEYDPRKKEYTGRFFKVKIKYVLYGGQFGIPVNYCIFSFTKILTPKEVKKENQL